MKFIIKSIQKITLLTALLTAAACSNFLEEEDPSNISPDNFFTVPEHAQAAVDGIYENLRFHSEDAGIFSANFQLLDALSGTAETETGQNSDLNNLYAFQYTGDNLHLQQWWRQLYEGISTANLAIERIPQIPNITEADAKRWVGHARFLRAFQYFWLVRLWGDVPLLTEPIVTINDPLISPSRAPQAEVYALIEEDLLYAEAAGFPMTDVSGRASQTAVKSLLSKLYLTMAGFPLERGDEYYAKSAAKAWEVISYAQANPKQIRLFKTYDSLHNLDAENRGEQIFQIQYAAGIANANYQAFFLPNNTNITASGEVGTTVPTERFLKSFENGDLRVQEKQFFFQSYYEGGSGAPYTMNKPYVYKHFDVKANGIGKVSEEEPAVNGTGQSGLNYPLIRFAEVLLIYAEAQNEVTGPTPEVEAALNQVRERAQLPAVTGVSENVMREAIWRERWHELCYEGQTWFDMVRLRKVYNETTNSFSNFEGGTVRGSVTLQKKHLLLPLPANDYRNNTNLRPNNDGW